MVINEIGAAIVDKCEKPLENGPAFLCESNPLLLRLKPKILKLLGLDKSRLRICLTHWRAKRSLAKPELNSDGMRRDVRVDQSAAYHFGHRVDGWHALFAAVIRLSL